MKIPNKSELQKITFNQSLEIDLKDFTKIFTKIYFRGSANEVN